MMDNGEILAFLLDQTRRELTFKKGDTIHCLLKCRYDEQTDFIFHLDEYNSHTPLRIGQNADYAGFVSYTTMRHYDGNYYVRQLGYDTESVEYVRECMDAEVSSAVKHLIDNKPVPISDAADKIWNEEKDRSDHIQHYAKEEALRWFHNRTPISCYGPKVTIDRASTDQVIRFINEPDIFVAEEAERYIVKHARSINFRLWAFDVTRKVYEELERTPGEHHMVRAINESLGNDEKKVTIRLMKDGQCFEGKIKADALRRMDYSCSSWSLDTADRRQFEAIFGRSANIRPKDILQINYGRKKLYVQLADNQG